MWDFFAQNISIANQYSVSSSMYWYHNQKSCMVFADFILGVTRADLQQFGLDTCLLFMCVLCLGHIWDCHHALFVSRSKLMLLWLHLTGFQMLQIDYLIFDVVRIDVGMWHARMQNILCAELGMGMKPVCGLNFLNVRKTFIL